MSKEDILKELVKIQERIEHDRYTWENIQRLINKINKIK